jgi:hypothetical protein
VPAGFRGSAVISSDQRIAATVNVISPDLGGLIDESGLGGEAYAGVSSGGTTAALPLLFKNFFGFNSFITVQNVGTATTNLSVQFTGTAGGNPVSVTQTFNNLAPNASVRFNQDTNTELPDGFNGSAVVTSSASDITAVGTQIGPSTLLIYNGFGAGSTELVFPLVNTNNSGFITGIPIQNIGTASTDVTVSYTPSIGGSACTETITIPAGGVQYFALEAFSATPAAGYTGTNNCTGGALFVGSGRVTANSASQPLVSIVNQNNGRDNKGGAYSALNPANGSSTVVFPLIQDRVAGFFTGSSIINVSTTPTTVTCVYDDTVNGRLSNPAAVVVTSGTLNQGDVFTPVHLNNLAAGFSGSATCTANATGARIVGIANQLRGGVTNDAFFVYEGTNN